MEPFRRVEGIVCPLDRSDVDTDQIIPKQFLKRIERTGFGEFLFWDWRGEEGFSLDRPEYAGAPILVTGRNFGCGSSREHAPVAIKASGISCVIAANFARIFYRNAINIGLAILECPAASAEIENGDEVTVDFDTGVITDVTKGTTYQAEPFPPFIKDMIARGGLMASLKAKEAAK